MSNKSREPEFVGYVVTNKDNTLFGWTEDSRGTFKSDYPEQIVFDSNEANYLLEVQSGTYPSIKWKLEKVKVTIIKE